MYYGRDTNCTSFSIDWDYTYAEGGFKYVYSGRFKNGPRSNQPCVAKVLKSSVPFSESEYFKHEMAANYKTLDLITRFNAELDHIPIVIFLNIPTVCEINNRRWSKALLEPLIKNFTKFNSNSGWTLEDDSFLDRVSQALSHFTYHSTRGNFLLCDIQGGRFNKGFALTDPVIMSHRAGKFGPTDLGRDGIITFFAYHECNNFCESHWQRPKYRYPVFTKRRGTSLIRGPSAATSRYYS
jgi:hypothetical protein